MDPKEIGTEMISAAEAAAVLGTTKTNLLMHIKRKRLAGWQIEGEWYVRLESLRQLQADAPAGIKVELCRSGCPSASGCSGCD